MNDNNSGFTNILNILGINLANMGRHEDAIKKYNKAIELNPRDLEAYSNKGASLVNLGRYKEALKEFDKVQELDLGAEEHTKINTCTSFNQHQAMLEELETTLAIDAHNKKGLTLLKLDRWEEALEEFNKVVEQSPNNPQAHNYKAITLGSLERWEEALKEFDKVIELNPRDLEAYNIRRMLKKIVAKEHGELDINSTSINDDTIKNIGESSDAHFDQESS